MWKRVEKETSTQKKPNKWNSTQANKPNKLMNKLFQNIWKSQEQLIFVERLVKSKQIYYEYYYYYDDRKNAERYGAKRM